MAWTFYDAAGNNGTVQLGTLGIGSGGTGAITAALAATALGVGATSTPTFATITATGAYTGGGLMTTGGNIVIPNAGNIGSVGDTNAITISSGGVIAVTATTASSSATTGAFTVAGGAGIVADLSVGDDVRFLFLKHSGTTDGSTSTSSIVYINLDGSDAASVANVIALGKDEAIILKFKAASGVDCDNLHVGTSSGVVRCTLAAIVDDGG